MLIRRQALQAALAAATTNTDTRYNLNAVQIEPPAPLTDVDRAHILADYYTTNADATEDGAAACLAAWIAEHPQPSRAVATDGHVLIIATDRSPLPDHDFPTIPNGPETHGEPTEPILIGADIAQRLIKGTMKGKRSIPVLETIRIAKNSQDGAHVVASTDLVTPTVTTIHDDETRFPAYRRVIPAVSRTRPTVRVCLAVDVLQTLIKAAIAATGDAKKTPPVLAFDIPIGKKDQGTGTIAGELVGSSVVELKFVAMPCHVR
jgi:hypothetical protein